MLKKIFHDEKGAVLPIVAVFIMVVFFGVAALVIDAGSLYVQRRNMVAAADAGALAGAKQLQYSKDIIEIKGIAKQTAEVNGADVVNLSDITVNLTEKTVKVVVKKNTSLFFAQTFGVSSSTVAATAEAKLEGLNPGVIPLTFMDTNFATAINQTIILHEKGMTVNNVVVNWLSGLLYLDGESGMSSIQDLVDRELDPSIELMPDLVINGTIDGKPGFGEFSAVFETWFSKAAAASLDPALRKSYMTGFIPITDTSKYVNGKAFPIAFFAEFVIVDDLDNKNYGVNTAFKVTDYTSMPMNVDYNTVVGNLNKNYFAAGSDKALVGYFTGKTVSIQDFLDENYTGASYEKTWKYRVYLID